MIIAVDYDNTYTTDPELFNKVIKLFQDAGHKVLCVSFRYDKESLEVLTSIGRVIGKTNCIFTGRQLKRPVVEALGYQVDIWIDDMPEIIGETRIIASGGWSSD